MCSTMCQFKSWRILLLILGLCHFRGATTNEISNEDLKEENQDRIDHLVMTAYGRSNGLEGVEGGRPIIKQKRAALGILRLATKRPHKTVAELINAPSQDSFVSVRGRRQSYPPILDLFRAFLNENSLEGVRCAVGGKEVS